MVKRYYHCCVGYTIYYKFLFQNTQVIGDSMEPSLEDGHSVIINKFIYRFKAPQREILLPLKVL